MNILQQKIKNLLPAYFAMVMATGIVSIALFLDDFYSFAYVLFYLNLVFLSGLLGMFSYRCIAVPGEVLDDFKSYMRGPGFFTIIAALCIVGNQFILLFQNIEVARILFIIAAIAWLVIGYGFFFNITVTKNKKS